MTKSPNFPRTPGAMQDTIGEFGAAFAAKLNSTGSALTYATFLPGVRARAAAASGGGELFIAGQMIPGSATDSRRVPTACRTQSGLCRIRIQIELRRYGIHLFRRCW